MRRFVTTFLFLSAMVLGGLFISPAAQAASNNRVAACSDPYAIVCDGASKPSVLVDKIVNNKNAALNYKAIFAQYGLTAADYEQFSSEERTGTIYKDGTIKVDGKVVGRSTMNLGRTKSDTFTKRVVINGQTYWGGSFDNTYHADTAKVLVLMKNGQLKFAAIASCGNPQTIVQPPKPEEPEPPKPQPAYACEAIVKKRVSGDRYSFTTTASASGGAKIVKAVYDFGDGSTMTRNNLSNPAEHTFRDSSRIRSTVHVLLPDGKRVTVSPPACVTNVTVRDTPPPAEPPVSNAYCSQFNTPELLNEDTRQYRFTVVANTENARFDRADFRFSDNPNAVMPASPNGGNQATITHAFPQTGDYTITATLHFTGTDGRQFSGDCVAKVSIQEDAPVVPPADEEDVCEESEADGKGCGELTDTGPGTIIASIFGGTSAIAAAGHFVIRRRLGLS